MEVKVGLVSLIGNRPHAMVCARSSRVCSTSHYTAVQRPTQLLLGSNTQRSRLFRLLLLFFKEISLAQQIAVHQTALEKAVS